jgi:hypothetical protein
MKKLLFHERDKFTKCEFSVNRCYYPIHSTFLCRKLMPLDYAIFSKKLDDELNTFLPVNIPLFIFKKGE